MVKFVICNIYSILGFVEFYTKQLRRFKEIPGDLRGISKRIPGGLRAFNGVSGSSQGAPGVTGTLRRFSEHLIEVPRTSGASKGA